MNLIGWRMFSLALVLLASAPASAAPPEAQSACDAQDDPAAAQRKAELEADLRQRLQGTSYRTAATIQSVGPITIPVVVHVVYNTATQNISDAQVLSQIDVLNEDFRRLNADRVNTPSVFQAVAADTQIQFVMAKRDPNGNPTNGITRTYSSTASWSSNGSVCFSSLGGIDAWPTTQYLNIWVVNKTGAAGSSSYPWSGSPATDGPIVGYNFFGRVGTFTNNWNYLKGRTTTHEVGHWLGLGHIWGDAICGSDLVGDTPTQEKANGSSPAFPHLSNCAGNAPNGDMFMNYMDYTYDSARNMFSQGQATRMNYYLTVAPRVGLLTSLGGVAPAGSADTTPPSAALTAPAGGALVSGSAVTVSASASDNVGVVGVQFKLDGANLGAEDTSAPYTLGWNTTLAAAGAHTLSAVARDAAGNIGTSAAITVTVDNAAPLISGVAASSISSSAATIGWTTSEPANAQVEFGTTTAYGQLSALSTTLLTSRGIALSGLSAGTLYHYRVRSRDQAGNLGLSGDFTFTTPAAPADTTAPGATITAPASGALVSGSALTISANAADNIGVAGVQFRLDGANLGAEDTSAPYSLSWNTTLAINGAHTLSAVARDAAGNIGTSAAITVTVDNAAPLISGVAASSISASAATISWTTSEPANAQVEFGTTTAYGQLSALSTTLLTSRGIALSGLSAGTLYHYRVRSRDQAGNLALSGDFTFSTLSAPDSIPPTTSILSPSSGANVKQDVSVKVSASDNKAVSRIELWADGALAKTQALSPAAPSATVSFAWRAPAKGQHTLQAKAYDAAGNSGASAPVMINVTGKMSAVSLVGAGSPAAGEEPRALMLSLQQAKGGASLAFSEEVAEAAVTDLRGRAIMSQSRQGGSFVMALRQPSGGRQAMEAGLWLIQMKDSDGRKSVKPLVVVK